VDQIVAAVVVRGDIQWGGDWAAGGGVMHDTTGCTVQQVWLRLHKGRSSAANQVWSML
jgi:hypothetical protein